MGARCASSDPSSSSPWAVADHALTLPTGRVLPNRDFSGQRLHRHVARSAHWTEVDGFEDIERALSDDVALAVLPTVLFRSGQLEKVARVLRGLLDAGDWNEPDGSGVVT